MALKKEDFATEELWAEYQAELDRARTEASVTARKNALKDADKDMQTRIDAAISEERTRLEASETERVALDRQKIDADRASITAERKSLAATKKLMGAGFGDEDVANLLPLFTTVADDTFDATIESFIKLNATTVKAQVDAAKQALLTNATPPNGTTGGPTDTSTQVQAQLAAGNEVGALDIMLTEAGYKP